MLKCSFSFPDLSASGSETMEEDDDPYCVLKVKRTASFREIRKSFQMLAKQVCRQNLVYLIAAIVIFMIVWSAMYM